MRSRRNALHLLGTGLVTGLAGCSAVPFGSEQEYAPVVLENDHDRKHMMSVTVTTVPEGPGGFTEYFSDVWLVEAGEEHAFEEGLAFTDHQPELMVLVVLEDETAKRAEFSFDFDLEELHVVVTEAGEIAVQAVK